MSDSVIRYRKTPLSAAAVVRQIRYVLKNKIGWRALPELAKNWIDLKVDLDGPLKTVGVSIRVMDECYLVYTVSPLGCVAGRLNEFAKYVAYANAVLIDGNFELNCRTGELRYKSFVNFEGLREISEEVICRSVMIGCQMMSEHGRGIAALSMGEIDAKEAFALTHPNRR